MNGRSNKARRSHLHLITDKGDGGVGGRLLGGGHGRVRDWLSLPNRPNFVCAEKSVRRLSMDYIIIINSACVKRETAVWERA